jgi:hypothetical protein
MAPKNPDSSIERLIARFALASSITFAAPLFTGCATEPAFDETSTAVLGDGQADWAQQQGRRDTSMVSYLGSFWQEATDCGYRGGCQTISVFVKLKVKRVDGADLNWKRVGIAYRDANGLTTTAVGRYFSSYHDGYEEWHVPFSVRAWQYGVFTFNAWYQDGRGNTFYDDNAGELHAIKLQWSSPVAQQFGSTALEWNETGLGGHIDLRVADLDYDKDLRLVWSTDGWNTVNESHMGAPGDTNAWYWLRDESSSFELWRLDLALAGDFDRFEYAIVYRHGAAGGGRTYEFWDNNFGSNYVLTRPQPIP